MSRNYRGDVEMSVIDSFMPLLMEKEDEGLLAPVLQKHDISYVYVKHLNIFRTFHCLFDFLIGKFPSIIALYFKSSLSLSFKKSQYIIYKI